MDRRIREHSKGLVEIASLPTVENSPHVDGDQGSASKPPVVQFIHQSVRDFLAADGFSFLRDRTWCTDSAEGHEFMKSACWNCLRIKDFEAISAVDIRVRRQIHNEYDMRNFVNKHQLLEYAVRYIFTHAAKAEEQGISQDGLRTLICSNTQGCFERWRVLHDAAVPDEVIRDRQGTQTRPIHVLAEYSLLKQEIAEKERSIDIVGGRYHTGLIAACLGVH